MSAATVPQPGAEDDWEPIDEAVRDHLGELLTAGTNLFSGSQLMDRLTHSFARLAAHGSCAASSPDKVAGVLTRAAGEMLRATAAAAVRAAGGTGIRAGAWQGQAVRRSRLDWERRILVAQRDLPRLGTVAARDHPGHRYPACCQAAEFAVQLMIDALAPTNFAPTNPTVIKKALDTGGLSLAQGRATSPHDLLTIRARHAKWFRRAHRRQGHGRHPGKGRVPKRADGADPVRTQHSPGARDSIAVQSAVDQQVLRDGSRAWAQSRAVGR